MTTDYMLTTESIFADDKDNSFSVTSVQLCFANVDRPPLLETAKAILLVVLSVCHLIVIVVCVRERKKASYKQDIVYMVALAIVDMTFCLSILPLQHSDIGLQTSLAFRNLPLLLLCMSIVILALRAIEKCKIFIRPQAKPWSFRFQILLCMVSNIFVAIPITYLNYLTSIPFAPIFWCIASFIILVSYVIIVWAIFTQASKNRRRNVIGVDSTLKQRHVPSASDPHNIVTEHNTGQTQNRTEIPQIQGTNMASTRLVRPEGVIKEKIKNVQRKPIEEDNEKNLAQTNVQLHGEGDKEVVLAHTSKQMVNGNKDVVLAEAGKQMGNCKVERKSPLHVSSSHIVTVQRKKGQKFRRAGFGLVLITIIYFLSTTPTWLSDLVDGAPCYLKWFGLINCFVNPFIYFTMIKSFRQAVRNLIYTCVCKCCKSN